MAAVLKLLSYRFFILTTLMPETLGEVEDSYLRFVNDDNSLYNLEVLSKDNADYELVEKSFMNLNMEHGI